MPPTKPRDSERSKGCAAAICWLDVFCCRAIAHGVIVGAIPAGVKLLVARFRRLRKNCCNTLLLHFRSPHHFYGFVQYRIYGTSLRYYVGHFRSYRNEFAVSLRSRPGDRPILRRSTIISVVSKVEIIWEEWGNLGRTERIGAKNKS